jgi:hypothetical protein
VTSPVFGSVVLVSMPVTAYPAQFELVCDGTSRVAAAALPAAAAPPASTASPTAIARVAMALIQVAKRARMRVSYCDG